MRPILATISQGALRHNLAVVKQHAPHSKIMAAVKANGYGHGLANIAYALKGVDGFAVLDLAEAISLREMGFDQSILLLEGIFSPSDLAIVKAYNLSMVVHSFAQLEMLEQSSSSKPYSVFIKMNTGMNRLGFVPSAYLSALNRIEKITPHITLMTHFAAADAQQGVDAAFTIFRQTTNEFAYPTTLANSAAILCQPHTHADWVRPGIMLYGATPATGVPAAQFGLKPVMHFTSEIISVQTLQAGDTLGYGNRFTATKPTRVGVVACGYADGYPRHAGQLSNSGQLQGVPIAVAGKVTQTLGRVSMDMLFADLTDIPEANIGAPVELWGNTVPVDAVAEACGTIGYELLCAVAPRVPFKTVD
ncbi:MAG TPA: alanine racemase [Methylotenera sp.]|nr:alanine racemase [Methylotenera sp.]HPH04411.1 alanine racemase [Methylotenera sp.]HPM99965.1 alanine racemase [Methylotenera sp.]